MGEIHNSLDQELLEYQRNLIEEGEQKEFICLDKDDLLSCLILCLLKAENALTLIYDLELSLREI